MYLNALCWSQCKERSFPYTSLNWYVFVMDTDCIYCAVRTESLNMFQASFNIKKFVTWFRRFFASHWPQLHCLRPGPFLARFVADSIALGQLCLLVLWVSLAVFIPPILCTYLHLNITVIIRTSGPNVGTFKQSRALGVRHPRCVLWNN